MKRIKKEVRSLNDEILFYTKPITPLEKDEREPNDSPSPQSKINKDQAKRKEEKIRERAELIEKVYQTGEEYNELKTDEKIKMIENHLDAFRTYIKLEEISEFEKRLNTLYRKMISIEKHINEVSAELNETKVKSKSIFLRKRKQQELEKKKAQLESFENQYNDCSKYLKNLKIEYDDFMKDIDEASAIKIINLYEEKVKEFIL